VGRPSVLPETAVMTLTARHPYDPAGFMDVYKPGRWDCESNLVFMNVIVQGASPGEWDGTAVYARFTAPSAGKYLFIGNFSGHQITLNLGGPWGTSTGYCPTTADHAQATALSNMTAGQTVFFGCTMTGWIIGYLESLQVYLIA